MLYTEFDFRKMVAILNQMKKRINDKTQKENFKVTTFDSSDAENCFIAHELDHKSNWHFSLMWGSFKKDLTEEEFDITLKVSESSCEITCSYDPRMNLVTEDWRQGITHFCQACEEIVFYG